MIWHFAATALIAAAVAAVGTWRVQDWRYGAKEAERLEAQREKERMDRQAVNAAARGHEKDKVTIQTEFVTIEKEVERVVEKPVYRDVCLDDDGLRVLTDAIRGPDAGGQPGAALRGPEPAGERKPGGDAALVDRDRPPVPRMPEPPPANR